jgi:glyoxylase-like metal-dependent hydrolase (beta-lactamase superfamily II)
MVLVLSQFSPMLFAGEKENQIIEKTLNAYGGKKLLQLQSLRYTDNIQHFFEMQSGHALQGPMSAHLNNYKIEVTLDLANSRSEFKRAATRKVGNHGSENQTTTHRIFDGNQGYSVDHYLQNYQLRDNINYNNTDIGYSQMLDTLIIKQLAQEKNNSQWTDTAVIQGQVHDVLTINSGTDAEYSLYLNQDNGYLTRMLKKRGQQLRSYDFLDHQQTQGITWAKQMFVSTGSQPTYYTNSRKLSVNLEENLTFNLPPTYQKQGQAQYFDASPLTIRQLAQGVYFVGQNWGYTLFIDAGDHYISAGAWGPENNSKAWQQGLALLNKTTGNNKKVTQHIVTHHHTDHMSALNNIVELGIKLIMPSSVIPAVNAHLQQKLTDKQIVSVTENTTLANGKVVLIDVPTSHASHNLVIYLPEHKLLFSEDIFGSSYQSDLESPNSWPSLDTYQRLKKLTNKLKQLNLPVQHYVSSHHGRVLSQKDINKALSISNTTQEELTTRLFP